MLRNVFPDTLATPRKAEAVLIPSDRAKGVWQYSAGSEKAVRMHVIYLVQWQLQNSGVGSSKTLFVSYLICCLGGRRGPKCHSLKCLTLNHSPHHSSSPGRISRPDEPHSDLHSTRALGRLQGSTLLLPVTPPLSPVERFQGFTAHISIPPPPMDS